MANFNLSDYDYELPENLIAQRPLPERSQSRLMIVRGLDEPVIITTFHRLLEHLPVNSLIAANNSMVFPARLRGVRENHAQVELVLLSPLALLAEDARRDGLGFAVTSRALVRPSRSIGIGSKLRFKNLHAVVLGKQAYGQCVVRLEWADQDLNDILASNGETPLPPYIKRTPERYDHDRYQTVYASLTDQGSVAAPTAGLHFTQEMQSMLKEAGHEWCELTLHVGYGTFGPIRCNDVRQHSMHAEYVRISAQTAESINRAIFGNRPIIAVGTTCVRAIEGVIEKQGGMAPFAGWLDTYIYPGHEFQAVTGLITNFHLPRSSLLVLVSAFAGRERILSVYRKAVEERMRFYSYGDVMFINRCARQDHQV